MRTIGRIFELCVTSLVALLLFLGCSQSVPPTVPTTTVIPEANEDPKAPPERIMVNLRTNGMVTLIRFNRTTPAPWPDGNSVSFRFREEPIPGKMETWVSWRVLNMHSENLYAIAKILKTDHVEMLILPITNYQSTMQDSASPARPILNKSANALVVDPRIPKEWLRTKPRDEHARQIAAAYPDYFRSGR